MKILRVDNTTFIKPDDVPFELIDHDNKLIDYWCWGYRWNKNEKRYSKQCMAHRFKTFEWVDEGEIEK